MQDDQGRTALDIVRHKLKPDDLSPKVRARLMRMGAFTPQPTKQLRAIETILLKAGAKTGQK